MRTPRFATILAALSLVILTSALVAQQPAPAGALGRMPVKEVSIFKDGHAFVLHEGSMPVDTSGNVLLDYLPAPVLGTFWAYPADSNLKVSAVTAGQQRIIVERTALRLPELLESNIGAEVTVTEKPNGTTRDGASYPATIVGIPRRSSEELQATSPPNVAERLPVKGDLILLRTADGIKALPLDRIQDVIFKSAPKPMIGEEEFRNLLTLRLDWGNRPAARNANVGLVYLQKGIRWIPSYRVALEGKDQATARLQAVLINELADLDGVKANLVVGVPSFAFKDTLDPLSLVQTANPLSSYFQTTDRSALSNAIASQALIARAESAEATSGPIIGDMSQNEDLFLFEVKNLTLKKGQRLSLPVTEQRMKYTDIHRLDVPFAPPPEVRTNISMEQQTELSRLLAAPKVAHIIRLTNTTPTPLTTAPAIVLRGDQALSQGTMTYTAPGAAVDLEIGKAVDVQVKRSETELSRTVNAVRVNGDQYSEVRLTGSIKLTNFKKETIQVEVARQVLGTVTSATNNGRAEKLDALSELPSWWRYYNWPYWWNQMNGIGRVTWTVSINPGQTVDLGYEWQYYWR
jgi:hypothetical protein